MNIYLEDSEPLPAVKIDTSPPEGFTISANPTLDWDKHSTYLVGDLITTAKVIRDEIQNEYDSITWGSGSNDQKNVWSKWFVATKAERDTRHNATKQKDNFKSLALLLNKNNENNYAQKKANTFSTSEPSVIDTEVTDEDINVGHVTCKTGSYTGNGNTAQGITEIGFKPKYVKIWMRSDTDGTNIVVFEATAQIIDDHASGMSVVHGSGSNEHTVQNNTILSLDDDGFTVDDNGADQHPNKLDQVYNYMTLK